MHRQDRQEIAGILNLGSSLMPVRMAPIESGLATLNGDRSYSHPLPAFNRLFYFAKGRARVVMEGRRHQLVADRFYLLPVGRSFDVTYFDGAELHFHHVHLTAPSGLDIFSDLDEMPVLAGQTELGRMLVRAGWLETAEASIQRQTAVFAAVCTLAMPRARALGEGWSRSARFRELLEYMQANCRADLTANELAARMHLSRSALSKGFRRSVGVSLREHMDRLLLQRIKDRLVVSEDSVKEIAADLRFSDPAYLFRFFRRHTGMSPGDFRKSARLPDEMR